MQRALVEMQGREKILLGKKKRAPVARTFYVSLDRADAFIEGGPSADWIFAHRNVLRIYL
jgi:hypothetical protein